MHNIKEDRKSVYEISYLLVPNLSEDQLGTEIESINKIIDSGDSSIIMEGKPERQDLAYTIRRKTVAGSYEKYDSAYFGWVKFETSSASIETIKKQIEILPSVIRMLVITTVRENTYLGKRESAGVKSLDSNEGQNNEEVKTVVAQKVEDPATVEEIDKSIDAMVKEV